MSNNPEGTIQQNATPNGASNIAPSSEPIADIAYPPMSSNTAGAGHGLTSNPTEVLDVGALSPEILLQINHLLAQNGLAARTKESTGLNKPTNANPNNSHADGVPSKSEDTSLPIIAKESPVKSAVINENYVTPEGKPPLPDKSGHSKKKSKSKKSKLTLAVFPPSDELQGPDFWYPDTRMCKFANDVSINGKQFDDLTTYDKKNGNEGTRLLLSVAVDKLLSSKLDCGVDRRLIAKEVFPLSRKTLINIISDPRKCKQRLEKISTNPTKIKLPQLQHLCCADMSTLYHFKTNWSDSEREEKIGLIFEVLLRLVGLYPSIEPCLRNENDEVINNLMIKRGFFAEWCESLQERIGVSLSPASPQLFSILDLRVGIDALPNSPWLYHSSEKDWPPSSMKKNSQREQRNLDPTTMARNDSSASQSKTATWKVEFSTEVKVKSILRRRDDAARSTGPPDATVPDGNRDVPTPSKKSNSDAPPPPPPSPKSLTAGNTMESATENAHLPNELVAVIGGVPSKISIHAIAPLVVDISGKSERNKETIYDLLTAGEYAVGDKMVKSPFTKVSVAPSSERQILLRLHGTDKAIMEQLLPIIAHHLIRWVRSRVTIEPHQIEYYLPLKPINSKDPSYDTKISPESTEESRRRVMESIPAYIGDEFPPDIAFRAIDNVGKMVQLRLSG